MICERCGHEITGNSSGVLFDVLLLEEAGTLAKPWLTAIEDDYSRMIVGYRLSFQKPTALTLRHSQEKSGCCSD